MYFYNEFADENNLFIFGEKKVKNVIHGLNGLENIKENDKIIVHFINITECFGRDMIESRKKKDLPNLDDFITGV